MPGKLPRLSSRARVKTIAPAACCPSLIGAWVDGHFYPKENSLRVALDTRTQRYKDDHVGLRDNHLLGRPSLDPVNHPGQLQRLFTWLSEQQASSGNVQKFIVSGSVFAPNPMDERVDPVSGDNPITAPGDEIFLANEKRRSDSDS